MVRAVFSRRFLLAVALQTAVLYDDGFGGMLHLMCIPLICTLPYSCGWIDEYKHGFVKLSLSRTTVNAYILGKFFACTLSGGFAEVAGAFIYSLVCGEETARCGWELIFLSAMLWASVAAILAAISNSRYIAYGGAFVVYYFLVILCERYWKELYFFYPYEWIFPEHTWIFDKTGIVLLLSGIVTIICMAYCAVLKRRLRYV